MRMPNDSCKLMTGIANPSLLQSFRMFLHVKNIFSERKGAPSHPQGPQGPQGLCFRCQLGADLGSNSLELSGEAPKVPNCPWSSFKALPLPSTIHLCTDWHGSAANQISWYNMEQYGTLPLKIHQNSRPQNQIISLTWFCFLSNQTNHSMCNSDSETLGHHNFMASTSGTNMHKVDLGSVSTFLHFCGVSEGSHG
jgi:hypothetical protein